VIQTPSKSAAVSDNTRTVSQNLIPTPSPLGQPQTTPPPSNLNLNPASNYSIKAPDGWQKVNTQGIQAFRDPTQRLDQNSVPFQANFSVVIDPSAQSLTLDQYAKSVNALRAVAMQNYSLY